MSRTRILTLIDTLRPAGAEHIAVELAVALSRDDEFEPLVCSSRSGGTLEARLRDSGVQCMILGRKSSVDLPPLARLRDWIRTNRVALIHGHMKGSNLWAGLIGRSCGLPALAHAHGQPTGPVDSIINAVIARLTTRMIAVSESERRSLLAQTRVQPNRIVTIHNGICSDTYAQAVDGSVRKEIGLPPESPIVGICAHLREEKNHETYFEAATKIRAACPKARFVVIGDGDRRSRLERLVAQRNLSSSVVFTGHREDVHRLLKSFDVAVLSSVREGLPLALLEYLACGLPVVATRVGGIPEAVRDGENGFLVDAKDSSGLAERVIELLQDAEKRRAFSRRAREIFDEQFSQDTMLTKTKALYRDVLGRRV